MTQSMTSGRGRTGNPLTPTRIALAGAVLGTCLLAVPGAQAASNVCSKVSPSDIAAIVGHSVPAGVASTVKEPATKKNDGIGGVSTTCTYGKETASGIKQLVLLDVETTTKPVTVSELQQSIKKNAKASGLKVTPYSGLGVPGVYFTFSAGSIHSAGISGVSGTHSFGAAVYATLPEAKLAALAKLAEKLQ